MKAPRWAPSGERLAGSLLAIAALTIVALALLALFELDRETELHREVIAALQVEDSLETLRTQVSELVHGARLAVAVGDASAAQAVERRAVEIDAELSYLAQHPSREDAGTFGDLSRNARVLAMNARSAAAARNEPPRARALATEMERAALEANTALERVLESHSARIHDRTLAQIRVSEGLRNYVSWLLAGSTLVLLGLFGFYRWVRARERYAAERIEQLAHYDVLTGLPNRVLLIDRLEQEVARARRNERGFALLMFDLDGFKQVNDTWGHAAGDRVLAMVGERARASVRASDTVGRLGGDEFMAILPEASHAGATQVAEKLRESMSRPYPLAEGEASIGASVGVSYYGEHGDNAELLQRAADAALYEAKRRGKNRVTEAARAAQRSPAM
ncbi:MAG TPA: GGDEF domain-containing protein [Usitatibacter sp.]|nr:GGDEF domain-containing protein [Usitatibacter sp.]